MTDQTQIILASASPRRRELMEMLGVRDLKIIPARGEERPHPELTPDALVKELSRCKAREVADSHPGALVIGADTIVVLDGAVLGKPRDAAEARSMLARLSGRTHTVWTGVTVIRDGETRSHAERTEVRFRPLTSREIDAYVATGEPLDKAGAYGAQGLGSLFVEHLDGDFFNVMGLPLCALGNLLKSMDVNLL